MKWLAAAALRDAEKTAFTRRGQSSYAAMCRAGSAVAAAAEQLVRLAGLRHVIVLCGPGNNGGDGFVAARCLHLAGLQVEARLTCLPARLKGDAARAWKEMAAAGVPFRPFLSDEAWREDPWSDPAVLSRRVLLVDALLGIGARGAPSGAVAAAIRWANALAACPVLAVDVPSGLDAETGATPGDALRADYTITFSRPKTGFAQPAARPWLGTLNVVGVGLPNDLLAPGETLAPDGAEIIALPELAHLIRPRRDADSHKGTYGHVLVAGGCDAYPHAPVLAACAAYRAGCGLVTLAVPDASRAAAAHWVPEATFAPLPGAQDPFAAWQAVAIGPGLDPGRADARATLLRLAGDPSAPRTVIDAGALTILGQLLSEGWKPDGSALRLILTPHPGEAARLLGVTSADIQADRPGAARKLAAACHAIVVLKGHDTLVAEPGGRLRRCMAGNPGMATAGTGDLLTGLIAGFLARGLGTEDAAVLGVFYHALAGDAAALARGEASTVATDLLPFLRI